MPFVLGLNCDACRAAAIRDDEHHVVRSCMLRARVLAGSDRLLRSRNAAIRALRAPPPPVIDQELPPGPTGGEVLSRADLSLMPGYRLRLVRRSITFAPSQGLPVVLHDRAA